MKINRINFILLLLLSLNVHCQITSKLILKPKIADSTFLKPSLEYSFNTKSILDLERAFNLTFDDSLYSVDARVRRKANDLANDYDLNNKDDLLNFFKAIDDMLFSKERFDKGNTDFYSESLNGRGASQTRTLDDYGYSLLYSTIAKEQSVDIGTVLIRDHLLNEVCLESGEKFYWDGSKQKVFSLEEIKKEYNLQNEDITDGLYATRLNEDELLAITYSEMAKRMNKNGFHEDAIEWSEFTIKLFPKLTPVYFAKAEAYYELENCKKAIETLKKIIPIDNKYVQVYNTIGSYYSICFENYNNGHYWYSKAIQFDKNNLDAHYGRGLCCAFVGNKEGALIEYNYLNKIDEWQAKQYTMKLKSVIDKK